MSRWEPGAHGRLQKAAMELYVERGFEQTTVADIAHRAGLTERTFFRYFGDKREVLFSGTAALQDAMVGAIADAPEAATPIEAVGAALEAVGAEFEDRRAGSRLRQSIIAKSADLQERELIKLATLAAALAEALRRRDVAEPAASLAAQVGIAVFHVSFARWVADAEGPDLAALMRDSLGELKGMVAVAGPVAGPVTVAVSAD